MTKFEEAGRANATIRGYILRMLVKGRQHTSDTFRLKVSQSFFKTLGLGQTVCSLSILLIERAEIPTILASSA